MNTFAHQAIAKRASTASRAVANRVQAKLNVRSARDSFEQEADRVANAVVDNASNQAVPANAAGNGGPSVAARQVAPAISRLTEVSRHTQRQAEEEPQAKLQCQAEEEELQAKLQRQSEEEEETQAKVELSKTKAEEKREEEQEERIEQEGTQAKLQRQAEEEPQAKLQRQPEEEEPQAKLQRQAEEKGPQTKLQRQAEEEEPQAKLQRQEEEEPAQTKPEARASVRDKRQFPELNRVEQKLFDTKGKGDKLDDDTQIAMETRFGADFSNVRIHTGAAAEDMSRELKAQAFTHDRDVFFNAGKYEPDTIRGRMLLAHELTHVVQQGAAAQKVLDAKIAENNAERNIPPPEPADKEANKVEQATAERIEKNESELSAKPAAKAAAEGVSAEIGTAVTAAVPETAAAPAEAKEKSEAMPEGESEAKPAAAEKAGPKPLPTKAAPKKMEAAKAAAKGGDIGAFLRRTTQPMFAAKRTKIAELAEHQKTKQSASAKLTQTEQAVQPPAAESASRAKASKVETLEQAPEPKPDPRQAREQFDQAMANAVPVTLEEVDKFKEEGKGRVVGQAVKQVVTADTQEVKGTYQEIDNPPPPAPTGTPEALPELETAPETAPIDMGDGVVGNIQPEHTDLSSFDKDSDQLLEKEGMKEEHLEIVDEGELAEAKQDRKTVKKTVEEGPREVKLLEQQQKQTVDKELRKEEQEGKQKMGEERRKGLQGSREDQLKTKSKIEQKRQAVTDHINGIYETANTTVKQKLEDLEKKSLKAFDDGEKQAIKTFEDNVKRRIDAFKKRRYDRFGGSLLWAKDKLFGMDDLPEVKQIFDDEKSRFITCIDGLIKQITADNQRVIQECKDIVANARKEIAKYVESLGPELQKTGQDALKGMQGKLNALDQQINAKEKELKKKLQAKREAAIKAIEEKIEKMKEAMSGLLAKLGNLLLNAMLKFFKWALKKAGYASDQLMGILNKGKAVIKKIVTDPIGFIGNIVKAVKDGIHLFVTNIKKHLIGGLISWLTGAMADVPITLPTTWDLKGILHLILQILGLTWDFIRRKLVKRLGEKVVRVAETTVDILKKIAVEGPLALWEMIKAKAAEIKQQVMEGIRNWVSFQVVKQAVIKLISFLNPAGAIIQAILAIYNTIMFFVENWDRIVEFVKTVFASIADIAMGKLAAAAQAVERAMAMTIPIILNFLARLLGLSGIGKAVSNVIKKIRKPIDKIFNKVIDGVAKVAKKLLKKVKAGAKALKEKGLAVIQWWKQRKRFKNKAGESHTLFFRGKGKSAKLMIATTKTELENYLEDQADGADAATMKIITQARKILDNVKVITRKDVESKEAREITNDITQLSGLLMQLSGAAVANRPRKADWKFPSDGHAKVELLSTATSRGGTRATAESDWWKLITNAKYQLHKPPGRWVRMHLISQTVGGRGDDERNLIPAPHKVNRGPKVQSFEQAAYDLVEPGKNAKPNVIWLDVHAKNPYPVNPAVPEYKKPWFFQNVDMEGGIYFINPQKKWIKDSKIRIKENVDIPPPDFSAVKIPSLSDPSHTELSSLAPGIFTRTVTGHIKREIKIDNPEPFADLDKFKARMKARVSPKVWTDQWVSGVIPKVELLVKQGALKIK